MNLCIINRLNSEDFPSTLISFFIGLSDKTHQTTVNFSNFINFDIIDRFPYYIKENKVALIYQKKIFLLQMSAIILKIFNGPQNY